MVIKKNVLKSIFLFDEHNSSVHNGIGTFLHCFSACLKEDVDVTMLSLNDNVQIITSEASKGVHFLRFPIYCNGAFLYNTKPAVTILRTEIEDTPENVFIINHFPCNTLLQELKMYFPLSKRVFVLHDHQWTEELKGSIEKVQALTGQCKKDSTLWAIEKLLEREKEMYDLADAVVCLNNETQNFLLTSHRYSAQRLFLIPNGIKINSHEIYNIQTARCRLLLNKSDKIFLFVGRTSQTKGIYEALTAFERVSANYPEAKLVILGKIYEHEPFAQLCSNSISHVTFAGQVTKEQISYWYAAADFGLMPSYYEQCSYAGIEMMAHGLPVVASDAYGTRTMFRDGYNAIVAHIGDRDNPEEYQNNLADAMAKAIEMNETQYAVMSANARECYRKNYTLANMREGYLRMFDKLINAQEEHQSFRAVCGELPMKDRLYHLILHSCDVQDCGLLHGKMGIALALATYARQNKQKAIEDYAGYLLKRTLHYVHKNMPWSFGKGLCGIVWGIEYLAQNEYMDIDTTDVCEELDRKIMQVSPLRIDDFSLEDGLEGLLLYVNAHIKSGNKNPFDQSFIDELQNVIDEKYAAMPPSLQKQSDVFRATLRGEEGLPVLSLRQFVKAEEKSFINWQDLSLSTGLAGLLLYTDAHEK